MEQASQNLKTIFGSSKPFEETDELCEKHGIKMMFIKATQKHVCNACTAEAIVQEDREIARRGLYSQRVQDTTAVLKRRSIVTDHTLLDATFGGFDVNCKEQHDNREKVASLVPRILNGEYLNLWLIGDAGKGKSHLAMSLLNALNAEGKRQLTAAFEQDERMDDKGISCLFIGFDEMLRLVRDSFNNKDSQYTESYFVDWCVRVDVLVIDDLGAETGSIHASKQATDFVHRMLYAIANGRRGKTTVITTNLEPDQRYQLYDAKILSRLSDNMAALRFKDSPDMRQSKFEW